MVYAVVTSVTNKSTKS